jgi:predicted transposase YbfD/YdcC
VPVSHARSRETAAVGQVDGQLPGAAEVSELVELFGRVSDPRKPRGVRHHIAAVLTVTVFAVLAGAANYRQIGDAVADLPQELLALAGVRRHRRSGRCQPPSEPTIRRVVEGIDAGQADTLVGGWLRERLRHRRGPGEVAGIAMDGKVVRNSDAGDGDVRLFSALHHDQAVVIAQVQVPSHTNEITQVGALFDGVDLAGVVVTGDAAHTQHATARYLVEQKHCDYLLQVKGNQPGLLAEVLAALPPATPGSAHHLQVDTGHGRTVHRAIWTAPADGVDFPHAQQVFRVRRDVFNTTGQRISKEIVHGVTSLHPTATAEQVAAHVRNHWSIENKSHWVRDVVYDEDHQHAYTGATAHAMAMLRNLAIGLIRLAGLTQITRTLERIAADRMRILPLLAASRP